MSHSTQQQKIKYAKRVNKKKNGDTIVGQHFLTKRIYYQHRDSILSGSKNITAAHIDGFVNFFITLLVMFTICSFICAYYEAELWHSTKKTFLTVSRDILPVVGVYGTQLIACFLFFGLQKFVQWKIISTTMSEIVHYFMIIAFCGYALVWLIFFIKLNPTQATFVLFQIVILGMKMHSFVQENNNFHTAKYSRKKVDDVSISDWESDELFLKSVEAYPGNLTTLDFFTFLFMPALVYDSNYPRTPKVRPHKVIKTLFAIAGVIIVIHTTLAQVLLPVLREANSLPPLYVMAKLCVPSMLLYVTVFFFIFEIILNGYAEVTRFGDRRFYDDWWNSVNYEEFARKWNKPVHYWLLRYVYKRHIHQTKNKLAGMLITFVVSAIIHEIVMMVAFRVLRYYLFGLMMLELIFISLGRRMQPQFGRLFYWFTMFLGTPLLALLYAREYYLVHGQ